MDEVIAGLLRPSARAAVVDRRVCSHGRARHHRVVARNVGGRSFRRRAATRSIDAQIARIDRLLNDSEFDERWKHRLDEEIKGARRAGRNWRRARPGATRVLATLDKRIRADTRDFEKPYALLLYADEQAGGRFDAGHAALEQREADSLRALTRSDRVDREWVDGVETEAWRVSSRRFRTASNVPNSNWSWARRTSRPSAGCSQAGDATRAEELMKLAQPRVFDPGCVQWFRRQARRDCANRLRAPRRRPRASRTSRT